MNLMFSYPIKRQKILASQMIAVWSFDFIALIVTKLGIYLCVFVGARFMQSSFANDLFLWALPFCQSITWKVKIWYSEECYCEYKKIISSRNFRNGSLCIWMWEWRKSGFQQGVFSRWYIKDGYGYWETHPMLQAKFKWYLVLYQIQDSTVYVEYILDCRKDYSWLIH